MESPPKTTRTPQIDGSTADPRIQAASVPAMPRGVTQSGQPALNLVAENAAAIAAGGIKVERVPPAPIGTPAAAI